MKTILLALCLICITNSLYAQAQAGTVRSNRSDQAAAVIELPYHPDIVKDAMNDFLSKKGKSKSTDLKGFTTFRNTQTLTAAADNADLYFKIERKSRQEKDISVVSLLLTEPDVNVPQGKGLRYLNMEQAKTYLNDLVPAIEAYNLEVRIKEQNQSVIKSESLYKTQLDNGKDLEEKRVSLENKMQENKADQEKHLTDVNAQKQKLTDLVNQRKL